MDLRLGDCTAIVGLNQTHKTSILDTLTLGLTGKHPIGPYPTDLAELLPPNAEELFVTLEGPTGCVDWRLEAPGGKARRPAAPAAEGEYAAALALHDPLVMRHIGELLTFGKDRMREALMSHWGPADAAVPEPRGLSAAQRDVWARAKRECADDLAAMAKWFRSRARTLNDQARKRSEWIAQRQPAADEAGGVEVLQQYEQQLATAQAWERAAALRARTAATPDHADPTAAYHAAKQRADDLSATTKLLRSMLAAADAAGQGLTQCPLCEHASPDLDHAAERIRTRLTECERQLGQALDDVHTLEDVHKAAQELAHINAPDNYTGPSADTLQATIMRLREAEGARKQLSAASDEMYSLQCEADVCKVLERESAKLLNQMLTSVVAAAEAAVNRHMPKDYTARLIVSDKAVEWRVVGRDGRPHKLGGMCGREAGALMVALACAYAEKLPMRMLLLDDRDLGVFDPNNLLILMERLRAAVTNGELTQVILVWNRPHEIPADLPGWTVIHRA